MILIGCGQLLGSVFAGRMTNQFGFRKAARIEFGCLVVLYIVVPFAPNVIIADILCAVIYIFNGFMVPLLMTCPQNTVKDARSTIASLANSAMYLAETFAGAIGCYLFNAFPGFFGIAVFSAIMIILALLLGNRSIQD